MQQPTFILPEFSGSVPSAGALSAPYYIHASQSLHEGGRPVAQLHCLCHWLNRAGYSAWLVDAPVLHGRWWTPPLTARVMAAHHASDRVPLSIGGCNPPGLSLPFVPAAWFDSAQSQALAHVCLPAPQGEQDNRLPLALPWLDTDLLTLPLPAADERRHALVYCGDLPAAARGMVQPEHVTLLDISPLAEQPMPPAERWRLLAQAKRLYAYADGCIVDEARLLGCEVVYVTNDRRLRHVPQHAIHRCTAAQLRETLTGLAQQAPALLERMVQATQAAAAQLAQSTRRKIWSTAHLNTIQALVPTSSQNRAECADALAVERLQRDYALWRSKAGAKEIDSDLCAEWVASGRALPPVVHLFAHGRSGEALADSLDDLRAGWLPPARLVVHADVPAPHDVMHADDDGMQWIHRSAAWSGEAWADEWVILMEAGTRVQPWSLIELLAAACVPTAKDMPDVRLVYAAHEAVRYDGEHADLSEGPPLLPHFPGGPNVEWLRGTNYLGGIVAVRTACWMKLTRGQPEWGRWAGAYRLALNSLARYGSASVRYVDKVLSRAPRALAQGQEVEEFSAAAAELQRLHPTASLVPGDKLGCWRARYPNQGAALSLIVPTGKQLGYLRSLLLSCVQYCAADLHEALLVVQAGDAPAVQHFIEQWPHANTLALRLVVSDAGHDDSHGGAYNHARSLNAGIRAARTELVLVCDDDVVWLDSASVGELRRLFAESQVAITAPRLVLQHGTQPLLLAGPHIAGAQGLLNYTGQMHSVLERGSHNRLHMAQDVAGVHGACWMARRAALLAAGGLDEGNTPLFHAVADLGYRLQQARWRLLWTPHASAVHLGGNEAGMTLRALRRDPQQALALSQSAVVENTYMRRRWTGFAGAHPLYSRHLSSQHPWRLDTDVVCTWNPHLQAKTTRPRVLALPLSSGSGQYRVIEPLDALQLHSLAQTCVVEPSAPSQSRRVVTALDVARLQPDRLLVQHSISDADIAHLRAIREAQPELFIVQLMDDLTSDLPPDHPNYRLNLYEGHTRTLQALSLSDRLIVSTQPLADYYAAHCSDIRVVPNALDMRHWGGFFDVQAAAPRAPRDKLRIGWVGAGQHQGDLQLLAKVVQALADEVDWVFMGMCPDALRPYIREFHGFVAYKDYPRHMAQLDLDIAVAPLQEHPFNACKSNLRLLEYGAMGWPVVCSDIDPYRSDNPPVMRVANIDAHWLAALRQLMDEPQERQRQGQALHEWVMQHYTLEQQVQRWFTAIFE